MARRQNYDLSEMEFDGLPCLACGEADNQHIDGKCVFLPTDFLVPERSVLMNWMAKKLRQEAGAKEKTTAKVLMVTLKQTSILTIYEVEMLYQYKGGEIRTFVLRPINIKLEGPWHSAS